MMTIHRLETCDDITNYDDIKYYIAAYNQMGTPTVEANWVY